MVVRVKRSGNVWMAMLVKIVVFVVLGDILNLEIVRAVGREGVPSVGLSPFASRWTTSKRNIASADVSHIDKAFHAGFVQVGVLIGKSGETIKNLQINSGG
ncbi:hypothetical protein J5N97_029854 [Dioscorea zingiberensis]|uniref:K Homology domain-containing protein n=1 Tax=Dioscorea zingiberensis TaxID=325984 RepID=A0A9D5H3P5_9LILI|nr:hypothetical protein J5N97_029854 [Dioscorea zingiberensis]